MNINVQGHVTCFWEERDPRSVLSQSKRSISEQLSHEIYSTLLRLLKKAWWRSSQSCCGLKYFLCHTLWIMHPFMPSPKNLTDETASGSLWWWVWKWNWPFALVTHVPHNFTEVILATHPDAEKHSWFVLGHSAAHNFLKRKLHGAP